MALKVNTIYAVLGDNSAGKSTLLKAIMGLIAIWEGTVRFNGQKIGGWRPHAIQREGLGYLPQASRVFRDLTVREHIELARRRASDKGRRGDSIPKLLQNNWHKRAGLLSGGLQQLLSIEMVLVQQPRVLLLDEPSAGLSPRLASQLAARLDNFAAMPGQSILLVEQNHAFARGIADEEVTLRRGTVITNPDNPKQG